MTPDGTPMDELPPPENKPSPGRWTIDGADWSRWELLPPGLLEALMGLLGVHPEKVDPFAGVRVL